jgi:aryl carrier-like protein
MTTESTDIARVQMPESSPTPMQLLAKMVDSGVDPDKLGKMMDLAERWKKDQAAAAFSQAMANAQTKMPTVVRDATNTQTNSKYALLETIQHKCRPIWLAEGLTLSFAEEDCPLPEWKRIVCDVRHVGGHCVRYHRDLPLDGIGPKGNPIGGMNKVQGAVSTGSYGQRVLMCDIFDIVVAGTDLDGQQAVNDEQLVKINTLIDDCREEGAPVDFPKFLAWLEVDTLDKLPAEKFKRAVMFLEKKKAKGGSK